MRDIRNPQESRVSHACLFAGAIAAAQSRDTSSLPVCLVAKCERVFGKIRLTQGGEQDEQDKKNPLVAIITTSGPATRLRGSGGL